MRVSHYSKRKMRKTKSYHEKTIERNKEIRDEFQKRREDGESSTNIFWDFEDLFNLKIGTLQDIVYCKGSYYGE